RDDRRRAVAVMERFDEQRAAVGCADPEPPAHLGQRQRPVVPAVALRVGVQTEHALGPLRILEGGIELERDRDSLPEQTRGAADAEIACPLGLCPTRAQLLAAVPAVAGQAAVERGAAAGLAEARATGREPVADRADG